MDQDICNNWFCCENSIGRRISDHLANQLQSLVSGRLLRHFFFNKVFFKKVGSQSLHWVVAQRSYIFKGNWLHNIFISTIIAVNIFLLAVPCCCKGWSQLHRWCRSNLWLLQTWSEKNRFKTRNWREKTAFIYAIVSFRRIIWGSTFSDVNLIGNLLFKHSNSPQYKHLPL